MPIRPLAVVERVIDECKQHVATEFRARDEALREKLGTAPEDEGVLAGPAFSSRWRGTRVKRRVSSGTRGAYAGSC